VDVPLILAIENDKQQIAQLTSIVRGLGAELVLADSAERALTALAQRVPDLILTPPLMLQKDDIALTTRLRELGDAAVHVQMLSIPILATSSGQRRGRLSILRTAKEESVGLRSGRLQRAAG
jgi:CheY-like chemotaxis protein